MSAELYFETEYEAYHELLKRQPALHDAKNILDDCYFYDPYSYLSVMWAMGMSWWQEVVPMLKNDGHLPLDKCEELLQMIEASDVLLERCTDSEFEEISKNNKITAERDENFNQEYMENKKKKLIRFLKKSVENKTLIKCSL